MATIQISKIQLRRGPQSDLPGSPTSLSPLSFSAGLDDGELGFTDDTGRLFIGQSTPVNGMPNYQRTAFPYQNIEVLTENSPLGQILASTFGDNQVMFLVSAPMAITATFTNLQTDNSSGVAQDFHIDLPSSGVNARVLYCVFDNSNNPIRQGTLTVVWNSGMATPPLVIDEANVPLGNYTDIQWSAAVTGSPQHVVLQYKNQSSGTVTTYFRVDRPLV